MDRKIVVLLLTKGRVEYSVRAIHSIEANLNLDGEILYYVADAGSSKADLFTVLDLIVDYGASLRYHHEELTAGQNWNRGIKAIYDAGIDVYLRLENDFELSQPLDVTPYHDVLFAEEFNVGCVRLGLLPINLDIQTFGYEGRIYQDIMKMRQYTWSGNPCLVHRKFHNVYGYFTEEPVSPGDAELSLDGSVRRKKGPRVWRPNELGDYGPFKHIGEIQSQY